jgi:hypothetical protein
MLNGIIMFHPQRTEKLIAMTLPTFSQLLICPKSLKKLAFHKQYLDRIKIAAIAEDFPNDIKILVFNMTKYCVFHDTGTEIFISQT